MYSWEKTHLSFLCWHCNWWSGHQRWGKGFLVSLGTVTVLQTVLMVTGNEVGERWLGWALHSAGWICLFQTGTSWAVVREILCYSHSHLYSDVCPLFKMKPSLSFQQSALIEAFKFASNMVCKDLLDRTSFIPELWVANVFLYSMTCLATLRNICREWNQFQGSLLA